MIWVLIKNSSPRKEGEMEHRNPRNPNIHIFSAQKGRRVLSEDDNLSFS